MPWPCPNGCPRDAGEYCSRHTCEYCAERLSPEDDSDVCNQCKEESKAG